ncbi:hypothetical protein GQX73_g495 [Xylaria multiplex]|uniref:Heterokaryon incompatibility domain-containing protein n=1 Tax=Xylaria multiplex TaxID=323545 RepID=A0A7C8MT40_9PEZI|nr:hypothetical protein GQX73_g495 [Xylaria multiplex]
MPAIFDGGDFRHEPLPDSKRFIRLITIQAAKKNQPSGMSIQLKAWLWEGDTLPPYSAISYTWGDPAITTHVSINGRRAKIRQNCEDAMIQASSHAHPDCGYIWIDAICIDQENNSEKSDQVAMMGQIYQRASRVFSCVGQHADDSKILMRTMFKHRGLLTKISTKCLKVDRNRTFVEETESMRQRVLSIFWRLGLRDATIGRHLRAFEKLLEREYFRRTWIKQELFMGRHITLCCGTEQIPFEALHGLHVILTGPTTPSSFLDPLSLGDPLSDVGASRLAGFFSRIWILRRFVISHNYGQYYHADELKSLQLGADPDPGGAPLAIGLEQISGAKCGDPRDRVYGILSTINWGAAQKLVPNYDLSRFKLAGDVMRFFAENISHANINEATITARKVLELLEIKPGEESLKLELRHRRRSTIALEPTQTLLDYKIHRCTERWLGYRVFFNGVWRLHDEGKIDKNRRPSRLSTRSPETEFLRRLSLNDETDQQDFHLVYSHGDDGVAAIVPLSMRSGDYLVYCSKLDLSGIDTRLRHLGLILRPILEGTTSASIDSQDQYSVIGQAIMSWDWCKHSVAGPIYSRFMMHFYPEDVLILASQRKISFGDDQKTSSQIRTRLRTSPCAFTNSSYAKFLNIGLASSPSEDFKESQNGVRFYRDRQV